MYNKIDSFEQIDNFESDTSFDPDINSVVGNDKHGVEFSDEANEKVKLDTDKKAQVIIFLSKSCFHCVNYDKDKFIRLKGKLNKLGNIHVKKIYADKDPQKIFNKYDIQFVPAGVVIHNNKVGKINGEISPMNTINTIKKLNS
jgi:hypothetical protein